MRQKRIIVKKEQKKDKMRNLENKNKNKNKNVKIGRKEKGWKGDSKGES